MDFDWMEPKKKPSSSAERQLAVKETEVRERAALLARLGHDKKTIVKRLNATIKWELEIGGGKALAKKRVTALVDEAMRRSLSLDPGGR